MTDIIQIQESEYDAILRQAVAVIDRTRAMVATTVCSAIGGSQGDRRLTIHRRRYHITIGNKKNSNRWKKSYLPAVADFIGNIGETVPL